MPNVIDSTIFYEYAEKFTTQWQEKLVAGITIGSIAKLFGANEQLFLTIMLLMVADLFLGVIVAIKHKTWSPDRLERGVVKFIAYLLSIFLVNLINMHTSDALGINLPIQNIYLAYLVATESLSILEHCSSLGMVFPPLLHTIVHGYKAKAEQIVETIVESTTTDDVAEEQSSTEENNRNE